MRCHWHSRGAPFYRIGIHRRHAPPKNGGDLSLLGRLICQSFQIDMVLTTIAGSFCFSFEEFRKIMPIIRHWLISFLVQECREALASDWGKERMMRWFCARTSLVLEACEGWNHSCFLSLNHLIFPEQKRYLNHGRARTREANRTPNPAISELSHSRQFQRFWSRETVSGNTKWGRYLTCVYTNLWPLVIT